MSHVSIIQPQLSSNPLPFLTGKVSAGFPSPATEYLGDTLDLNELCIQNPVTTFFARVDGDSLKNAGIDTGDIVVVDRSLALKDKDIIIAVLDGEFTIKRYRENPVRLVPENPAYSEIIIRDGMEFLYWGKVTYVIKKQ